MEPLLFKLENNFISSAVGNRREAIAFGRVYRVQSQGVLQ
jgi:hypothetical protein